MENNYAKHIKKELEALPKQSEGHPDDFINWDAVKHRHDDLVETLHEIHNRQLFEEWYDKL